MRYNAKIIIDRYRWNNNLFSLFAVKYYRMHYTYMCILLLYYYIHAEPTTKQNYGARRSFHSSFVRRNYIALVMTRRSGGHKTKPPVHTSTNKSFAFHKSNRLYTTLDFEIMNKRVEINNPSPSVTFEYDIIGEPSLILSHTHTHANVVKEFA